MVPTVLYSIGLIGIVAGLVWSILIVHEDVEKVRVRLASTEARSERLTDRLAVAVEEIRTVTACQALEGRRVDRLIESLASLEKRCPVRPVEGRIAGLDEDMKGLKGRMESMSQAAESAAAAFASLSNRAAGYGPDDGLGEMPEYLRGE